jgi:Flp pilus assembly protein TadG
MRLVGTQRTRSRGQALVEFAIVLPVITLVVLGLFDLGRAVFTYNTLAQAARQANRQAIVDQNTDRVKAMAVAAAPTIGLTAGNVTVCFKTEDSLQTNCSSPSTDNCSSSVRVIGCLAIVTATLTYTPITPVISTIWPSFSLTSTSVGPIDYVCPTGTQTTCP